MFLATFVYDMLVLFNIFTNYVRYYKFLVLQWARSLGLRFKSLVRCSMLEINRLFVLYLQMIQVT
jgi:hypothetical protein